MTPPSHVIKAHKKAVATRKRAHAPYSGYHVGAAVIAKGGGVYTGCNVENASYGGTVCAERTAILKAVSEGEKSFDHVVVVTTGKKLAPPCAFCLQVMAEFCHRGTQVWLSDPKKIRSMFLFQELLPHPFDPSFLKS